MKTVRILIMLAVMAAYQSSTLAHADTAYPLSSETVTLTTIGQADALVREAQEQFWQLFPPSEDWLYVHSDKVVRSVVWGEGWPTELKNKMYAEMNVINGNLYPVYTIWAEADRITGDLVYFNMYGTPIWLSPAPTGYSPYGIVLDRYGVASSQELSEAQQLFSASSIGLEIKMLPENFIASYEQDLIVEAQLESLAAPVFMMMSQSTTITNLMLGIEGSTNGTVEIEVAWPSNFTDAVELFAATDLVAHNWELIPTNITTSGSTNFFWTDSATNYSERFYVAGNADLDTDSDFLTDAREQYFYSTSSTNSDTDGDGVIDGNEIYDDGSHGDNDGFITDPLVQDSGYLLPDYLYSVPTTNLAGFSAFDPPTTNMTPNANTPAISEWTRTGGPGDTIALAAMGSPTNYVVYALGLLHTSGTTNWFSGGHGAVTLPGSLPDDEMILVWPIGTNGVGPAIALNKTEVWWNQTQASTGEEFSIFGRNLGTNCHVWIEEKNEWLDSISCNPYKADFLVPTNYANGSYTLWAHNGTGHEYGFADSLNLEVVPKILWDEDPDNWFDVTNTNYANGGAKGNGVYDDWPAIEAAIDDADDTPWSTVYFPEGTYRIGSKLQFYQKDEIRAVGAGMDLVTIQPHDNYTNIPPNRVWAKYIIQNGLTDFELKGMTLKPYGKYGRTPIRLESGSQNIIFDDIRLDQTSASVTYTNGMVSGDKIVNLLECTNVIFRNCKFLQKVNILAEQDGSQIFVENCSFVGGYDAATLFGISGAGQISIVDSIAHNLDDTAPDTSTNACCQGRWVHNPGGFRDLYFGENSTSNMTPRTGYSDANVGEHILFEFAKAYFRGLVVSSTSNSVTFSSPLPAVNFKKMVVVVQKGGGQGQNRIVRNMAGNTVTVDKNWIVKPSSGAAILIGTFTRHTAIFNNSFDGRPRALGSTNVAVVGIMAYGGCVDLVAEDNRFHEIRYPFSVQSKHKTTDALRINQPNFFNLFVNNEGTNCYHGIAMYADKYGGTNSYEYNTPQLLGNVFRGNVFDTLSGSPLHYEGAYDSGISGEQINMEVFDRNSFTNYTGSLVEYVKIEASNVVNQVMIDP